MVQNKLDHKLGGNFSFNKRDITNGYRNTLKEILPPINSYYITNNVEFVLTHFPQPIFPRTISTYKSHGKQFLIFSKEEIIKAYEESEFIECRVNAYPFHIEYKNLQRYPPNFIFIDIDATLFESYKKLEKAFNLTINKIKIQLNGHPTILWTGNGYHIYLPIDAVILEEFAEFAEFENPSLKFIRFAESYLSCGNSDPSHNPTFKSCLIRIPGSFNSKCSEGDNEIKIIQKWDGIRQSVKPLLVSFHIYLVNEKLKEIVRKKRVRNTSNNINSIFWIETLLKTPINDYRKNTIALIMAPYLINIRKMHYDTAYQIMNEWGRKCNEQRRLEFTLAYKIKYSINVALRKKQLPMKFDTLKSKNRNLHDLILMKLQTQEK